MSTHECFVEPRALKALSRLQPWRTAFALILDWGVIIGAAAISIWANHWLVYLIAVAVIAGRQHAIAVLMHDFAHYRFIRDKATSDWIADLVTAWPLLATCDGYRRNHVAHHRYTNTDQDPDWVIKVGKREFTFPQEMRFAVLNLLGYFVAVSSLRDMRSALKRMHADDHSTRTYKVLRISYYLGLAVILTLVGGWTVFAAYWLVPYFTLFFLFLYVRSVADHFGTTMDYSTELTGTRTVLASPLERAFFAPHNVGYHCAHHAFPSVPFYRLPALHAELMKSSEFASQAHITRGFFKGLWHETVGKTVARPKQRGGDAIEPAE